jgi:hypothetical protein
MGFRIAGVERGVCAAERKAAREQNVAVELGALRHRVGDVLV